MKNLTISLALTMLLLLTASCGDDNPQPKPRGYFRIDLPEKQYVTLDTMRRYSFDYPVYSTITNDIHSPNEKEWINVEFPAFKGTIHISYKDVDGNLPQYVEDSYQMITKHINKATGIRDSIIINKERNVYGLVYFLDGEGVASPLQFYLTDSTAHFLRGSLYFNVYPNNDSLQPVINFITDDVRCLIKTLKWK
ncbi:MAG: gliding motility lipoprotein GldD [Bacteroidales bacterium]|nr:gliding motility lipoprotein GldD [Bacteroidales bacterium]MBQ3844267.1 gliding motility lipoprotein GldD [Bacteroidales bacterium]